MMFKIRKFINPPYTIKEIFIALSTLIVLLSAPLVVIHTAQGRQFSVEAAENLLTNPGFESGSGNMPTGWEKDFWSGTRSTWDWVSDGSTVRSGMGSAKITSSQPNDAMWTQDVSVEPYSSYLFKGWIKTENVTLADPPGGFSTGANLSVYLSFNRSPGIWGTQDWTEESLFFCSTASETVTVVARIGYNWSLTTGTVYFDDMSLEKTDPPFTGQHVVVCLLPEHRSLLTDPNGWIQKLDDAYLALQDLTGQTPYDGDKILIQEVVNYAGGLMIAGNPILWFGDYVPGALDAINDYNDLSFGPIHELSHDFDVYGSYYTGGGPINPENWGNFKLTYVADELSSTYPTATFSHPTQGYIPIGDFPYEYFVVRFAQPWLDAGRTDWQNMNNDVYTGLLYLLKEDIGWEPFRQTFRDYAFLTGPPPATDLGKVELFAHLLSANAGVDITPYFQSWGFPIAPAPDIVSPSVSITSPSAGSTVFGTISIQANATDNVGVTKVEFYVDGELKGTDTSSPYSYSWDTTTIADGTHTLTAKAYDALVNVGTSSLVTVTIDNTDPIVSLTAPSDGSTVSDTVNVTANALDSVGVTRVEFYVDGVLESTDTSSPYSYSWDTTLVSNGSYSLLAKAYDAADNVGTSTTISVTVNNVSAPTVDIKVSGSDGPITIVYNTDISLSWASTNSTSCTASGSWSSTKGTSGSENILGISSARSCTITCTGDGGSASDTVSINVGKIGDLNLDNAINIRDFGIFLGKWGKADQTSDFNKDSIVNIRDFGIFLGRWGT